MKSLTLIVAFLPLVVFSLLSRFLPHGYIGVVLGLIILVLIPVMPFTEQFAREAVPQAEWSSPTFKKINRVLSTAWGVAIFAVGLSRVTAAAINGHTTRRLPETLLGLVVPVAIIVYMLKFSKSYPDRVTHEQAQAPPAQAAELLVKGAAARSRTPCQ
jgi:hypothetical protein